MYITLFNFHYFLYVYKLVYGSIHILPLYLLLPLLTQTQQSHVTDFYLRILKMFNFYQKVIEKTTFYVKLFQDSYLYNL